MTGDQATPQRLGERRAQLLWLRIEGATFLTAFPAARDFIADATAHPKFIAYGAEAAPLIEKARADIDDGFIPLNKVADRDGFVATCRKLRI